ncbi:M20 family metallopeptidase [Flexivirga oryzae]|uniref:Peptidase M20 domain-containing protein 2 n=1 Tax=Flexivirga oryzae TaxID=1794944 RepID=A0A839MYU1_9MICO|nr:amidohydrolase [Flexivirga oryzae]
MSAALPVTGTAEAQLLAEVDRWGAEVVGLSHGLHREPELGLAEFRSRDKVSRLLRSAGFAVQSPVGGLETALVGSFGSGELVIALCAEYDALPGIGHACGHNVNGAASVGAALGLAAVADELDLTVLLIGTPAEETIGGKVQLLDAGVFDGVHAAMMVHASAADEIAGSSYALGVWDVEYAGQPAHAAVAPWHGVNAADAVTLAYQAVGLLRQQLRCDQLVSFVIHEAGRAPNVIPASARATVELRARTVVELRELQEAVRHCLDAGAMATGAQLQLTPRGNDFAEPRQDTAMTRLYAEAMSELGRTPVDLAGKPCASTDMGNVSHVVPSIQPMIGYDVAGAIHHTPQFAQHGVSASADRAVLDGARGLALVGARLAQDPAQRHRLMHTSHTSGKASR